MIRIRVLTPAILALLGPRAAPGQAAEVPFGVTRMALDLTVDYGRRSIRGTQTLWLRNVSRRDAEEVPLLLNRLMTVSRVADLRGGAVRFRQDVVLFEDDSIRQVNAVVVRLERPLPAGDSLAIVVHYGGRLVGYAET
ncbi:MAG TPA: hypothetical protein VK636_05475, partial [Gemmatimonadaceae bacterium]|nr:hypothetical protein [Gemmatimonadaceae bacterium]